MRLVLTFVSLNVIGHLATLSVSDVMRKLSIREYLRLHDSSLMIDHNDVLVCFAQKLIETE